MLELGEQCDDGNLIGGDGCSAICTLESGTSLIAIEEIVTDPQLDWSDSTDAGAAGDPFDSTAGTGVVDLGDQYIEITNFGATSVFLNGLQIKMSDGSVETYVIGSLGGTTEFYSAGGSGVLPPGAVLVIGDPPGTMLDDVFIEFQGIGGILAISDVEVGDAGQPGDGAPAVGSNGAAVGIADEAVRRVPASFTGDDAVDFDRGPGDPGL